MNEYSTSDHKQSKQFSETQLKPLRL